METSSPPVQSIELTLNDFTTDAYMKYPSEFAYFPKIDDYTFEQIAYLDNGSIGHMAFMLLIGDYDAENGKVQVWASTNGHNKQYFAGQSHEVCKRRPNTLPPSFRYGEPFKFMRVVPTTRTSPAGDQLRHFLDFQMMESVFQFVFLQSGQIPYISKPESTDMLSDLETACRNYYRNRKRDVNVDIPRAGRSHPKDGEDHAHAEIMQNIRQQEVEVLRTKLNERDSEIKTLKFQLAYLNKCVKKMQEVLNASMTPAQRKEADRPWGVMRGPESDVQEQG